MTDLRTREGRRREIVEQVTRYGGFSVFWVTENRLRALMAVELQQTGEMVVINGGFPWHNAQIKEF